MDQKVWFKLRQTHYPAPPKESLLSGPDRNNTDKSPINLGHIIPKLTHLDFPLNTDRILPFPPRMRPHHEAVNDFCWSKDNNTELSVNLSLGAPIASTAISVSPGITIRFAFKKSIQNHENYGHLDTYTISPTRQYVSDCLEELDTAVTDKRSWTVFMITGLKIARGGKRSLTESRGREGEGGPEITTAGVASVAATLGLGRGGSTTIEGEQITDFIWAVRLAKVHKGILTKNWSVDPYTSGATFGVDEGGDLDIAKFIKAEGLDHFEVLIDDTLDEAVVLDSDDA